MKDENGKEIHLGDTLLSEWGFKVVVVLDKYGTWVGKLVCKDDHACKDIPFALADGEGYTKVEEG
jgi:hypothetical protein